jgi:hypothetical protein
MKPNKPFLETQRGVLQIKADGNLPRFSLEHVHSTENKLHDSMICIIPTGMLSH